MSVVRPFLLAAAAAVLVSAAPSFAADYVAPSICGVPAATLYLAPAVAPAHPGVRSWFARPNEPRIVDVQPFDPHNPPPAATPKYVTPQIAYLASPLCNFPNGVSDRSWYDGKLFYIPGGVQASPDTFMVIERK